MAKALEIERPFRSSHKQVVKIGDDSTGLLLKDKDVLVENDITIGGNVTGDTTFTGDITTSEVKSDNSNLTIDAGGGTLTLSGTKAVIDSGADVLIDAHDGVFNIAKAGETFCVAASAYAGMILGYKAIGETAVHTNYTLGSSYAVPDSNMYTAFTAPPSGAVEVMVQIIIDSYASYTVSLGLSDNATYNSLGNSYEQGIFIADESDMSVVNHRWIVTGLTSGTRYDYYLGAKVSSTSNASYLKWGGTSSGRYADFIMKVTALPVEISFFAEYS